jgi:uncharacterized membrane protein
MQSCDSRTAWDCLPQESLAGGDSQAALVPHEWTLKRNCSLSPRQFAAVFGSLAVVSVVVASIFAYSGAWWILVFAFIEVAALVAAFVVYARHAGDYERIVVTPDALVIEFNSGNHVLRREAHPAFAHVEYPCPGPGGGEDSLIGLAIAGKAVAVGRFVPRLKRESLAQEIRTHLLAASRASWR